MSTHFIPDASGMGRNRTLDNSRTTWLTRDDRRFPVAPRPVTPHHLYLVIEIMPGSAATQQTPLSLRACKSDSAPSPETPRIVQTRVTEQHRQPSRFRDPGSAFPFQILDAERPDGYTRSRLISA